MSTLILFPNQLFKEVLNKEYDEIFLVEHPKFFTQYFYNKKKLVLHRASMRYFYEILDKKFKVKYISYKKEYKEFLNEKDTVKTYDPIDHGLRDELESLEEEHEISLEFKDSPLFLTDTSWNEKVLKESGFLHSKYYKKQRKRLNVLLDENGDPIGGKWSYDSENRKKIPKKEKIPEIPAFSNHYLEKAKQYVKNNFKDNPGDVDNFIFPVTHEEAQEMLDHFLNYRLDKFGPYQDAIDEDLKFGYHSLLSSSLNTGLITPERVLDRTLEYFENNDIRINSVEGFLRQIIGWREFVRAMYHFKGQEMGNSNFWGHDNGLPIGFYNSDTGIKPLDVSIKNALSNGYCHHIERLMILGNFLLLCETDPDIVYDWFMEMFIDAYEWVMIPNIHGMSQFAFTEMMTKPYISSSNYIKKMSHYKEEEWCDIWDGLYWRFISENKEKLEEIPRMNLMIFQLEKMNDETLEKHLNNAERFLNKKIRD